MHILYAKGRYVIRYLMKTDDTLKLGQLEESLFRKGLFTGAEVQRNTMVPGLEAAKAHSPRWERMREGSL